jgi:hypothetical protein
VTPNFQGTPGPTEQPTATSEGCKKILRNLAPGGLSALNSVAPQKREAIMGSPAGVRLMTCLAVAGDDSHSCNALSAEQKAQCLSDQEALRELKGMPKEAMKGHLMYRVCMQGSPEAACDKLREAITAGDVAKCGDFKKASFRTFCEALASGDAKKCDALPEDASDGPDRGTCAAFTSEDGGKCPKDSPDCVKLANSFAAIKKQGLGGFQESDPALTAARGGKQACAAIAKELESLCDDPK